MKDIDVAPLRATRLSDPRPQCDTRAERDRLHPALHHSRGPTGSHRQGDIGATRPIMVAGDAASCPSGLDIPSPTVHTRRSSAKQVALCYRELNEEEPFMRQIGGQ